MKAVLISIQPRHCENIASGKKTVEVRKTAPKIPTPFKCYIYMTKSGNNALEIVERNGNSYAYSIDYKMAGTVIGEFVCDRFYNIFPWGAGLGVTNEKDELIPAKTFCDMTCLTEEKICAYIGVEHGEGYGWHISDLKIYDKPKDLSEFFKPCPFPSEDCDLICPHAIGEYHGDGISGDCEFVGCDNKITRPPQSWCYLEDEG